MSEENRCPQCGVVLPEHAPQGLCPGCLLKRGLETRTGASQGGSEPAEAPTAPPTPAELAPYFPELEILELVGRGGMGVVYKARQKRLDRLVALKILTPKTGQDPAFAERFAREARAMAMLSHPHIVAVHDFGQTSLPSPAERGTGGEDASAFPSPADGRGAGGEGTLYYFLMEFVDGANLRRLLDTGKLAPTEALAIVPQICDALQYAHDHGVVHRDIKPENVLLDKEGRVKIADFGIAKLVGRPPQEHALTGAGQVMGTPHYMAPEQLEHPQEVDHRADIYSLGVVFYQMLTGELPIGRFAPPSKKVQIDVRLDEVVLRALEKEPDRRYQQASEIKTHVETIVTTQPSNLGATPDEANRHEEWRTFLGIPLAERPNGIPQIVSWPGLGKAFLAFLICGLVAILVKLTLHGISMAEGIVAAILLSTVIIVSGIRIVLKHTRGAPGACAAVPRLSKTALTGAIWGGPFFLIIVLALFGITLWTTLSVSHLLSVLPPILMLLLATPIGVPIFGYVALKQIRRSAGRLYGLELTLFDLLAFPLLALDAVIAGLAIFAVRASAGGLGGGVALFFIVVACVVLDSVIVRWSWRAVSQPPASALPADQPKRAELKTMLSVAAPVLMFCLGVFGVAFLLWSVTERIENSRARIHTCIFEADAKLVDELVPRPTQQPAKAYDFALENPGRAPQTAQVNADVFGRLLADGANPPGLLDDQMVERNWWPKRATSSRYFRRDKVAGHGLVDGYLGLRRHKDILQLRVQYMVLHGMNGPYQYALIDWEGSVPPPETARVFFIPYSRGDGTARYLVIALEVGDVTGNDRAVRGSPDPAPPLTEGLPGPTRRPLVKDTAGSGDPRRATAHPLAVSTTEGPLQVPALPAGWKAQYMPAIDFYSISPAPEGSGVLMFSPWPPDNKPEDIPTQLPFIADEFVKHAKSSGLGLISEEYEVEQFVGNDCQGRFALFQMKAAGAPIVQATFMMVVDGRIWNGQFTGRVDDWKQALTLLKGIKASPAKTVIDRVNGEGGKVIIEGRASNDARLVFRIGKDKGVFSSGGFPKKNSRFTAMLSKPWLGPGFDLRIVDSQGSTLSTSGNTRFGPMSQSGQVVFRTGILKPEADGWFVVAEFHPDNRPPLPISVRLESVGGASPTMLRELKTFDIGAKPITKVGF